MSPTPLTRSVCVVVGLVVLALIVVLEQAWSLKLSEGGIVSSAIVKEEVSKKSMAHFKECCGKRSEPNNRLYLV